jgi:hypothetical protein
VEQHPSAPLLVTPEKKAEKLIASTQSVGELVSSWNRRRNTMRSNIRMVVMGVALILSLGALARTFAQHHDTLTVGKKGMVTFTTAVRAGDTLLKAGMYHVRHVVEGNDHVVTFKPVTMPAGYREYQMTEGAVVARLKCTVEPAAKKTRNTKIVLGRNAVGEPVVTEIQIAGEKAIHKF